MPLRDGPQLAELAGRAAEAGIASQIHAIGDGAVRTVLDVLATAARGAGRAGIAWSTPSSSTRPTWPASRPWASPPPCSPATCSATRRPSRQAWGARSGHAFPLADLDRAGTLLPFGTDAPVEPADPWPGIAAAVTRRGAGWPQASAFHPEQAIDLARALRAACLDGPRSAHLDDQGHLGVGARADFLVLPGAAFEAAEAGRHPAADSVSQRGWRPCGRWPTVLDGEVVWRAPDFDPEPGPRP